MDAATAGATTDAAIMAVATMAVAGMATDLDTVIEGDAALQVAAAIAAGLVEVDFAAMAADSAAEVAADSAAEAVAFMEVAADSTAAVIAVEGPTVVAIGNF